MNKYKLEKLRAQKQILLNSYAHQDFMQREQYINILLIDDDRDFIRLVTKRLNRSSKYRYCLHSFTDEFNALKTAATHNIDLVLMDYHLENCEAPVMENILRPHFLNDTSVIYISSDMHKLKKVNNHLLLKKPFCLEDFETLVEFIIQNKNTKAIA